MGDAFTPDELRNLVDFLQNDDHLCPPSSAWKVSSKPTPTAHEILVLGTSDEQLSVLIKAIRLNADKAPHIPVLGLSEAAPARLQRRTAAGDRRLFYRAFELPDVRLRVRFLDNNWRTSRMK
jgi:hypothetical protein